MSRSFLFLFFLLFSLPLQAITDEVQATLDSLKKLYHKAPTLLEKVEHSSYISELYAFSDAVVDSTIAYRDYAYDALHQIPDRAAKEEAYTIIVEAIIFDMNVDSFAQVALNYVQSPERKLRIYYELGNGYYFSKSDYNRKWCLEVMDTINSILQKAPDEGFLFKYYYGCVRCHLLFENPELLPALEKLLAAEAIIDEKYEFAGTIYRELAYVYQSLNAYDKALSNGFKARTIAQKKNQPFYEVAAIDAIMEAALSLKRYALVEQSAAECIEIESKNSFHGPYRPYYYLGKTAMAKSDLKLAKKHFRKALQVSKRAGFISISQTHQALSQVWFLENDLIKAQAHADSALLVLGEDNLPELRQRYRQFAKIYEAKQDYETAYRFLARDLREIELKDSINNPYDIIATLLSQNFEQEKTILDNQIQQRNRLLWILLVIALGVISAAIIFFRNSLIRKRLAEKVLAQNKAILAAQDQIIIQKKLASLGQLTAGIAHEIKNPLNFINNFAEGSVELHEDLKELLVKDLSSLTKTDLAEIKDIAKELNLNSTEIRGQGGRIDKIVQNMMNHSRDELGEKELVQLNQLIKENTKLAYHGFRSMKPSFQVNYDLQLGTQLPELLIFKQAISRVLLNILNNACYAVFEKQQQSSDYKPIIQLKTKVENNQVLLSIRDNGIGIKEDLLEKIYNPFFTTKPPNGINTGLGLSICYDIIVKQHQGNIDVNSEVGEFTEFLIFLPIQKQD